MERQQRKRRCVDDRTQSDAEPPSKKTKTRSEAEREAWASWIYPPEFWDRLPELSLTRKAVAEHNRRTRLQRRPLPRPVHASPSISLVQFARHGGPDLTDLRGYPHPISTQPAAAMSASESAEGPATRSVDPASTLPTTETTKTTKSKRSTPYNRDFERHLEKHGIHAVHSSQHPNLQETRAALAVPRPSLSPSKFSDGAFEAFQDHNDLAKDEDDVMAHVLPVINGPWPPRHASARNTVFGNLAPLTDGTIAPAVPDIYYGTAHAALAEPVFEELGSHIVPSTMEDKPLAANFFVELKGPNGTPAVAARQARYDGAIGARAMHSLQNYREEEVQYDGRAYTYSSTYHAGTLKLYAHHPTAPTAEGGQPEYHMTNVDAYAMSGNRDTFVQGATAFRNARDLAKQHRDGFIRAANDKASAPQNIEASDANEADDSFEAVDSYESYEAYEPLEPLQEGAAVGHSQQWSYGDDELQQAAVGHSQQWSYGDDELQQSIANATGYDYDDDEDYVNAQPCHTEGDSGHGYGDDPSLGLASSSTSSHKRHGSYSGKDRTSKGQKGQKHRKRS